METKIKNAVETYQCPGCILGHNISCFKKSDWGKGCGDHMSGTKISGVGKIFLGMPKPFTRLGHFETMSPRIFETYEECGVYDKFNIPVWKYKDENGHTLVRGIMPRRNEPFIHIFLEDCLEKVNCYELSEEDVNGMD